MTLTEEINRQQQVIIIEDSIYNKEQIRRRAFFTINKIK